MIFIQKRMRLIFLGYICDIQRPFHIHQWIFIMDRIFMFGAVKSSVQIEKFTVFFKRLEPMGKSFGDVHDLPVFRRESLSMPFQKSGRFPPDIDDYIKNRAGKAGDQLDLRFGRMLKMHAPERTFLSGEGMIDLQNMFAVEQILQFSLTEKPGKYPTVIPMGMGFNDKGTG